MTGYFLFLGGRGGPLSLPGGPLILVPRGVDNFGDLPVIGELDLPVIGELDNLPCCPEILPIVGGGGPCPCETDNIYKSTRCPINYR